MIQYQGKNKLITEYTYQEFRERMNTFSTSTGERFTKKQINTFVDEAKAELREEAYEENRWYCWSCGHTGRRLSCSHIISVNKCQNDGRAEIAWLKDNMQLECMENCHQETERRAFDHHANARYKKTFIEMYNNREI